MEIHCTPLSHIITPAIKYLKVVIPRLNRGIQKELDTPIKSEYDMFLLFNCRGNKKYKHIINYKISPLPLFSKEGYITSP
jgi:hypothetical protein